MADPLGFIPRYFSQDTENKSSALTVGVYAISGTNYPESEIIYNWKNLRPLTTSSGEPVYSVADDRIYDTTRSVLDELIESGPLCSLGEGREVIVPVNSDYRGTMHYRVRRGIILLPLHPSAR